MSEFGKRAEVTVETMGKVHNPTGEGVRAISTQAQATAAKHKAFKEATEPDNHETIVKEIGSSRRNITRKKTEGNGVYDNKNKKQGGHGKGKWSDPMDGTEDLVVGALNKDDPLYDETEEESGKYILSGGADGTSPEDLTGYDSIASKAVYGPMLTLQEFKIRVLDVLREYFDSADADEVIRSIDELKCKEYHSEVVKKAVSLSLDEGPRERELVSRLLTCLHPSPLADEDMEAGFDLLLDSLDDLCIDIPDGRDMVGSFLARAVVDEVLPPAFLSNANNDRAGDAAIERAVSLLSREHCTVRLEHVWGPGDGRPVDDLKTVMDQLLKEYLLSRELDEAARCVQEMKASHYHHELVKRGVKIAMEEDGRDHAQSESSTSAIDAMAALFSFLVKNAIVSENQVSKGLSRLDKIVPDLSLDVPAAPAILEEFKASLKTFEEDQ